MKNDLISRSAAIEAIEKHIRTAEEPYHLTDADKVMNHAFEIAASCVYNLSAAQPERKRGKWVYAEDKYGIDGYHCNQCGFFVPWDYAHKFINYIEDYHFCPNCGANMRGEKDE